DGIRYRNVTGVQTCALPIYQEFDTIDETTEFCQLNYGVSFPMMAKVNVNGDEADPLFDYLTTEKSGLLSKKIKWNFTKFLVDRRSEERRVGKVCRWWCGECG